MPALWVFQNCTIVNRSDRRGANIGAWPDLEFRSLIFRSNQRPPLHSVIMGLHSRELSETATVKLKITKNIYFIFSLYFSGEAEFGVF